MNEMQVIPNPFPGLRPFKLSEQHLFFGREGLSDELLERLTQTHFLTVVGTSGSGKSSLVRAGLLPLLYGGYMKQAGPRWHIAFFRPGDNPIRNMALSLNKLGVFRISKDEEREQPTLEANDGLLINQDLQSGLIEAILRRSALGLVDFARESTIQNEENLLVVVDQFEEIFRFKNDEQNKESENEAAAFVKLLLEATREKNTRIYVVLTMRSDFLGDCAQFRDLPEAINEGQYLIPRMNRDQQRKAICSPAAVYGVHLEPRLLHRLLNDVGDNPNQLPILQHALMRTWDYWLNHRTETIDLSQYQGIGGMNDALSLHADEAYNQLPDKKSKHIAERLFKCLTLRGSDNREVRRPTKLREICAIVEAREKEVIAVIDVFRQEGRSFLMPPSDIQLDADSVIDISHESLIRGWKQLKEWVDEETKSATMYRRLADDAVLHKKGKVRYWRDPALELALKWRTEHKPNQSWAQRYHPEFDLAMVFLDESQAERDREREKEEEQQRQEEERKARELEAAQKLAKSERQRAEEQAQSARRLKWMVAALALMFLTATGIAAYALVARSNAIAARREAEEQRGIAEEQQRLAEKQRIAAEEQRQLALQESERRLVAEQRAKNQAAIAQEAQSKAESEARRANAQAQVAERNLKYAKEANTRDETNRLGLIALERGDTVAAFNHFQNLLPSYTKDPPGKWWVLHNLALTSRQAGDYASADKYYAQALAAIDALGNEVRDNRIATLRRLAQSYYAQGHYIKAAESYKKLLALLSEGTTDPLDWANVQSALADIYFDQGNNADAQPLYEGTLNVWRGSLKAERELIATLNKLAQVYSRQERYYDAEPLLKEVIAKHEEKLAPDHINIAESYNDLALLYQKWGKEELAKAHYKLAQDIREIISRLDRSQKTEADKLQILQEDYTSLEKFGRAEILHKRELALREKLLKLEDPALALELEQMASFYVKQRRYSDAEPLYERALQIRNNTLKGITDRKLRLDQQLELISNLRALASVYLEQGKYPAAEQLYKRALENRESVYGTDNLATTGELASLALLYSRQRQFQTAEAMHKRVVTLWQNRIDQIKRSPAIDRRAWFFVWTLAPESYDAKYNYSVDPSGYIDSSNALASIYTQQGRYTEAEAQYVESLKTLVWLSGEIEDGSNGILSTKYTGKPSSQYFLMNLSKQYYTALAETLESYAALLRKMGVSREAEASAMELRAKEVRDKEAKAYRNENYP